MKIVIAGAGKIGSTIAQTLNSEGHDVSVIDSKPETLSRVSDDMDVICFEGSATNPDVLNQAEAGEADLVVAATEKDEVNMICGISARKLGAKHVISRIRDTEYLSNREFLQDAFGLDMIVNPEYECAKEIARILRFPGSSRVDAFSKGSVEIAEYSVSADDKLSGLKLKDLPQKFGAKVLVSVIERGKEVIIPNGMSELKPGDVLSITGTASELRKFFILTGKYKKPVKNVMIMGGGRISVYLCALLLESGMTVCVIERDRQKCEDLSAKLPGVSVVCGDGTRSDVLYEEGINSADAFVALTGDDASNIITSMFVSHCPVEKIITKVSHSQYPEVIALSGLKTVVTPQKIVAQQLARYVRAMGDSQGSSMETLYRLAEGRAEAIEFIVGENAKIIGQPLRSLKLCPNVIIAAIIRGNRNILPDGNTEILPGDHAIITAPAGRFHSLDEIVEGIR